MSFCPGMSRNGPSQLDSDEISSSETDSDSSSDEDFQEEADIKSVDFALDEVKIDSKSLGWWVVVEYEK